MRTREAAIGNLFADAMRAGTHADAAVINGGGIRAGKTYEPGARITHGDILAELPFNNRIVVVEIAGRELQARDGERLSLLPRAGGRFPQVSGIEVAFDLARDAGQPRVCDEGRRRAARRAQDLSRRGARLPRARRRRLHHVPRRARASRRTTTHRCW